MAIGTHKRRANRNWLVTTMLYSGALVGLLGAPGLASAGDLPAGGTVAAGAATISSNGQTTTVTQTTSRAVINWDSFSVAKDKTVDFLQPNANSATLNRVTGDTTSTIAGQIHSNGAVYLINPNGIAITSSGTVQTGGGFVASTLNMADADFMAGKIHFAGGGSSARVSNAGEITAGQGAYVALLGGGVANSGKIAVPMGRVGLGSGEDITLDLNGDGFMQVAVPTKALASGALIDHSGTISASGGLVVLDAASVKDAVRNVINLSGSISADSASGDGGHIVLFGGDGGTVTAAGTLSARATGASGTGGTVETSGAKVDFTGLKVDTSAVHGATGTWLVDPTDLTVDSAAAGTISTNLATSNVTLQTNADGTTSGPGNASAGNGDINFNSAISWSSGNALTLSAYHDININAAITSGTGSALTLRADNSGTDSGSVNVSGSGAIGGGASQVNIFYNTSNYSATNDYSSRVSVPFTAYMLVNNATDLQRISENLAGTYAIGKDIDASSTATWNSGAGFTPIGTSANPFTGTLAGTGTSGSSITGLTINTSSLQDAGLFGVIGSSGKVSDVHLVGGSVSSTTALTGWRATVGGLTGTNLGTITRSSASTTVNSQGVWADWQSVGGLVGSNSGTVSASSASGTISADSGSYEVGGLVGTNWGLVSKSFATGRVNGIRDSGEVGGLVGTNNGGTISQSYASGEVHGPTSATSVGGLAGKNYSGGLISDTYATGAVLADQAASFSGIVALGGLVGSNYSTVTRSFATGSVGGGTSSYFYGGLVGFGGGETNSFWDVSSTGQTHGGTSSATGLTTAQMQDFASYATTYTGFDFANVWAPPAQSGQAGQTASYYPTLYATTPVVSLASNPSVFYGASLSSMTGGVNGGTSVYAFGPNGDSLAAPAMTGVSSGLNAGAYAFTYAAGNSATSTGGVTYRVINGNGAGTLTVTPAALTVTYTADPLSRLYGAANPNFTGTQTATGLVNGDTLAGVTTGTATFSSTATSASNVGTYAVTGSGLSANSSNYSFTFTQAAGNATALSVTPAALSVMANPLSRTYGSANPTLTYDATGLVNGDTLSGSLATAATNGSNVGTYAITQGTLAASSNYDLTFTGALLTVNPAPLTVTYTADPFSRTYGSANPTFTGTQTATGLVNGDTLAGVTTGTASYSSTATAASNVGAYAVTGSGLSANSSNYIFTFAQADGNATALSVTPRPVNVVADPESRLFGVPNPPLTYVIAATDATSGLVNGDGLTGALATPAAVDSPAGDYQILQGTLAASPNYIFNYTGAVLRVIPSQPSLSSTVTQRAGSIVTVATKPTQDCTGVGVSASLRTSGQVVLSGASGGMSCQ